MATAVTDPDRRAVTLFFSPRHEPQTMLAACALAR